ncbi:MAG: 5-formyltetrahydrofolate cyclo-ligase [Gammaproteobacteria bacterium]|nr:5-formyltetrahydrofolate cyclo-ligase [Gammaproteobacteria bacterium]NIR81934.1 5-formyltetrahydrofolate cyclo-ligase [Gammaproteobacteria bacterium]NIR88766.1 5-formyltetrahydrofolate cyclo-ligase [Gammaproteobacteria bacterium]NIU03042.1 5-formyltetrahydrofolate cyclo-ligase [Gammaproteobacteria bacterium]NIV50563.1 5-formyltetrahydrofolate cyclo-ligase [Gammaproteobacteria bacterium]
MPVTSRADLRSRMRHRRRRLAADERVAYARCLTRILLHSGLIWPARRIACYLSNDGEMDLGPLFPRLRAMRKETFLPALHRRRLLFLPYEQSAPLVRNRFGIAEPARPPSAACPPQGLDLVLVPLVAFDGAGNRLGMGGGYYDRTFAYLRHRRYWRAPALLGVAYEFQQVAALPAHSWDIPLHGVVTERGLRRFAQPEPTEDDSP